MSSSTDLLPAWSRHAAGNSAGNASVKQTLVEVAEHARSAAQAQGYSVGWAQGRREAAAAAARVAAEREEERQAAEALRAREHAEAVEALQAAAQALTAQVEAARAAVAAQAGELAWALTETLVDHEVRGAEMDDVVARVLAHVPASYLVSLRVHPDHSSCGDRSDLPGVDLVADASLGRLDAVAVLDDHALDLRIDTAMTRVREVLR